MIVQETIEGQDGEPVVIETLNEGWAENLQSDLDAAIVYLDRFGGALAVTADREVTGKQVTTDQPEFRTRRFVLRYESSSVEARKSAEREEIERKAREEREAEREPVGAESSE
ncbi:MAG: hypothetical protein C4558_07475 [Dehalococcoidia bacterium]|nr:MAG: hypothetical protein C4558_07475 [Dehalococcoidia bacterium]